MKGSPNLHLTNRINSIKKQIDISKDKLRNEIQRLKNNNADFVASKQKEITNIQTKIKKT